MAKPGRKAWKYEQAKMQEPPLCKCGCGQKTIWCKTYKRFNEFVNGHNSKFKPPNIKAPKGFIPINKKK